MGAIPTQEVVPIGFLRKFVHDLATLKLPVTAAATVATVLSVLSPFGVDVGPDGPKIIGAVVGVGLVAAFVERYLKA